MILCPREIHSGDEKTFKKQKSCQPPEEGTTSKDEEINKKGNSEWTAHGPHPEWGIFSSSSHTGAVQCLRQLSGPPKRKKRFMPRDDALKKTETGFHLKTPLGRNIDNRTTPQKNKKKG